MTPLIVGIGECWSSDTSNGGTGECWSSDTINGGTGECWNSDTINGGQVSVGVVTPVMAE